MTWDEYRSTYLDFGVALHESQLIARAAHDVLAHYPSSLPAEARKALLRTLGRAVRFVAGAAIPPPSEADADSSPSTLFHPTLYLLGFITQRLNPNEQVDDAALGRLLPPDFTAAIFAQQLSLTVAHVDAFMADTLKAICGQGRTDPAGLR